MDRLNIVADKLECTELVTRVARGIDRCDAAILEKLFHPDATDDHGIFVGTASDFIAWVIPLLQTMKRTQHVIGQVLIEVDGDQAAGESYFLAHHQFDGPEGEVFMVAAGRYLDRFEKRNGNWKISHRHAVYDWNSTTASTDNFDRDTPGTQAFGARGHSDASYAHLAGIAQP
ncbi:MAG: nuclear transport factor 2 family protein [Sphingorhabdus sp.]